MTTVENCLVLYAQGRTLSKRKNMKEDDRKHGNKKFMNEVLIQRIIGNAPFLCESISCRSPFKAASLLLNNSNLALNKF